MSVIKHKVLEVCKSMLSETIRNLKAAVDESQKAANEYGPPKDRYDSFRTQLLRKRDMYALQLSKAMEQKDILDRIEPGKKQDKVEFGALVFTDKQNIFISIGLGKLEVNDQTFFAISPQVPIFKALQGRKAGEEFTFNNNKFKILEII